MSISIELWEEIRIINLNRFKKWYQFEIILSRSFRVWFPCAPEKFLVTSIFSKILGRLFTFLVVYGKMYVPLQIADRGFVGRTICWVEKWLSPITFKKFVCIHCIPRSKTKCILEMSDLTRNKLRSGKGNLCYYTDQLTELARTGELIEGLFLLFQVY